MRRIVGSVILLSLLLLLLAAPAAAAPPLKESGTQQFMFAHSSSCGPSVCTDTIVDAFTVDDGVIVVCLSEFRYNARNGRLISDSSSCTDTSSTALVVTNDLSASLAPTSVGGVTVSAQLTAFGPVFTHSDRGTFSDGTCTFRFRSSGTSSEAAGTLTINGVTTSASGFVGVSEFTVSSRCN